MRILIDADGCPVVNETIKVAHKFNLESIIFCDTSHNFDQKNVKVIVVSKGIDAVDFAILNNIEKGDIVITQDYGLASLVLSRNSYAINQSGMVYTNENIDELLYSRYISKKMRNSGARIKGPKKRDKSQDIIFKEKLEKLILNII
ncbi:YaiI/YqxD family protein [Intestinibacter bartlettii]|uniref:YaiI/YqxD family protein n=1 Tax=Intestinibacter bartlettii TaxID=261299 RepID=UPI00248BF88D|nr:YaiI/YqxD family protein [Intestinibacter bartlettii]